VTIAADSDVSLAMALHEAAHATCFVAGSCHVPIAVEATCRVTGPTAPPEHEYR
jgi:organic hydroperoxide reductase OsmC/OhrA